MEEILKYRGSVTGLFTDIKDLLSDIQLKILKECVDEEILLRRISLQ